MYAHVLPQNSREAVVDPKRSFVGSAYTVDSFAIAPHDGVVTNHRGGRKISCVDLSIYVRAITRQG